MANYKIKKYKCRLVRDGFIHSPVELITCADEAAMLLMKSLKGLPHEEIHAIFLNNRNRILGLECISRGGTSSSAITPRDLFRSALAVNAVAIVLGHNHPSGDPLPSTDDKDFTKYIMEMSDKLGFGLLDHLVCCPEAGKWMSVVDEMTKDNVQ